MTSKTRRAAATTTTTGHEREGHFFDSEEKVGFDVPAPPDATEVGPWRDGATQPDRFFRGETFEAVGDWCAADITGMQFLGDEGVYTLRTLEVRAGVSMLDSQADQLAAAIIRAAARIRELERMGDTG